MISILWTYSDALSSIYLRVSEYAPLPNCKKLSCPYKTPAGQLGLLLIHDLSTT